MDLEARILSLERKNRALTRCLVVAGALITLPWLLAAQRTREDSIRARKFELVDEEGRVRADLSVAESTAAGPASPDKTSAWLTFYRSNGQAVAKYDQMGLKYFGFGTEKERVSLRNSLGLSLNDTNGNRKVLMWVNYDGKAVLELDK